MIHEKPNAMMFEMMMTRKENLRSSRMPHSRSRYRQAKGMVTSDTRSWCRQVGLQSMERRVSKGRTSIGFSSTKPAVNRVHGYFQLVSGRNTSHGSSWPYVGRTSDRERTTAAKT